MADTSRKKTKTGKKNAPARAGSSADRSAQRGAELAVLRHVIAKGYVSRQTVRDVQGRLKRGASGESATLLGLLRGHVSDAAFEELTVIYRSAGDSSPASRTPKTSASNAPPDIVASLPEMAGMARLLALLSRRSVRIAAGVGAILLAVAGLLWLGAQVPSWFEDDGDSVTSTESVRGSLAILLSSPAGTPLPDTATLLPKVTSIRGRTELATLRELVVNGAGSVRLNAARLLGLLGDTAAGPALESLAAEADALTRLVSLDCLGRLRGVRPVAELGAALSSERHDVRDYAIDALREEGSVQALEALVHLIEHPHRETRVAAARAVLALQPSALGDVLERFGGGDPRRVAAAARVEAPAVKVAVVSPASALKDASEIEDPTPSSEIEIARAEPRESETPRGEAREVPAPKPTRPIPSKPTPKASPGPTAKASPKRAKPAKPAKPAVPPSIARAKKEVPPLLAQKKYAEARALLERAIREAVQDDAELFRLRGLVQLGAGELDEAVADMHRAIDVKPDWVLAYFDLTICYAAKGQKGNVLTALTMALRLGFRDLAAIRREDRLEIVKRSDAFRELMEHYFYSPLAAEKDDSKRLRYSSKHLQSVFQREADPFIRALAIVQFPEAGGLEATEFLARFLKDKSTIVRRALSEVLSATRDAESIAYLCKQAEDGRAPVHQRRALMWTLHHVPGPGPQEALLTGLADRDVGVRVAAAEAFGDRPDRRAVGPLIDLLGTTDPLDRLRVAESLGKITGKDLGLVAVDWSNWWEAHRESVEIGPVRNPCSGILDSGTVVIPPAYSERSGEAKKRALIRFGGTLQTEEAVAKALQWLARHQDPDGRWNTDEWALRCDERKPWERVTRVRERTWDTQLTGLALMAFLGAGHHHLSGEYRETIRKGLDFLKKRQRADGYFTGDHYHHHRSHEIATIAVTEAYLMTRDCELRPYVERAVRFILQRQHLNGGWGWYRQESYTSLTGWNLMALMTSSEAGLRVPATPIVSVRHYLDRVTVPANGPTHRAGFAFETLRPAAEVGETLSVEEQEEERGGGGLLSTVVGLWCRAFLGQSSRDARVSGAVVDLRRSLPRMDRDGKTAITESLFFGTQSALLQGGAVWKDWNKSMQEAMLGSHVKEKCERGSWAPSDDYGRVYSTAMGTLLLESYYRLHVKPRG